MPVVKKVANKRKLSQNGDTPQDDKENPQKSVSLND